MSDNSRRLLALGAVIAGLTLRAVPAQAEALLLDVALNGRPLGEIIAFEQQGDHMLASLDDMRRIGLPLTGVGGDAQGMVDLGDIPELTYNYDERKQSIDLVAGRNLLDRSFVVQLRPHGRALKPTNDIQSFGGVLNYDLFGEQVDDPSGTSTRLAGSGELRFFHGDGLASTSFIADLDSTSPQTIRLDTAYAADNPDTLFSYQLGDSITGGLAWSRPIRMGGARFGTNRDLRPDLITTPTPIIQGSTSVPSVVDVYINDTLYTRQNVPAGPFELNDLPVVNGQGEARVVVRDALGRQTVQVIPFYASQGLLAPGLFDYSISAGAIRENYGVSSFDYGVPAAETTLRYGFDDTLTFEGHGEFARSLALAGGGALYKLGNYGVLSGALAVSRKSGGTSDEDTAGGGLASLNFEHYGQAISYGASITQTTDGYGDLASLAGDNWPTQQLRFNIGLPVPALDGSLGAGFFSQTSSNGDRISVASATYSRLVFDRAFLILSASSDLDTRNYNVGLSISLPLGRYDTSAGVQTSQTATTFRQSAARITRGDGDWGWRADAQEGGDDSRFDGSMMWNGKQGDLSADVSSTSQGNGIRAGANGSLLWLDGELFAADTINDTFAVVDTSGEPDITVYRENREVGKTGASGKLVVDDLRAYTSNRIAVEPLDFPFDRSVIDPGRVVVPRSRSGVIVKFDIDDSARALILLVLPDGAPVPLGARLASPTDKSVVGYDGQAYIGGLKPHSRLSATWESGSCVAEFDLPEVPAAMLGPYTCQPETAP
ncbi:fimbria/pilus outer membrane usher protein [Radicibacter daui]|uniref:fimbria/pilus outer membrane usher protein n=1 Tax=Radicibacter daui TaxID=3064829 RepID=UPI0040469344